MATNYPSHWWSFAIAGCIFVLFILCIYWCITRRNRNSNSQYTPIDQAIYNEENVTNIDRNKNINRNQSRPSSRRSSFAFKKLLRLNEDESLEDGFDATSHNQSVISIGGYHAKQSSRYQSFNIGDEDNEYNFTQLSAYLPNAKHDKENENRIATIKEMLSTQHSNYSSLINSSHDETSSSSSSDNNGDIEDNYHYDQNQTISS